VAERVCLYALVAGAERPLRAEGITGERLRPVKIDGVHAVIGPIRRVPKPTTAMMRRYDEIQRELMECYASVVPARFGSCAQHLDELAASIRDRRESIRRTLRLVHRRAQMTTRVLRRSESIPNQFRVHSEPVQSALRTSSEWGDGATQGTQYLQRRRAELQVPGAQPLRDAVARWVRAERAERHEHGRLVGSLYHLVPRGAAPAYRRAMERAAIEAELTAVVTGPWPPYAFASVTS
jgi:hypothetical protein